MSDLGDAMSALSAAMEESKDDQYIGLGSDTMEYPLKIDKILTYPVQAGVGGMGSEPGELVSIRPVAKEYEKKTFLGVYLGDFPVGLIVSYRPSTKALNVMTKNNPAIFVPDLDKVIFGCESWWGAIKSPDELKAITDNDIENIWYVKAIRQLEANNSNED